MKRRLLRVCAMIAVVLSLGSAQASTHIYWWPGSTNPEAWSLGNEARHFDEGILWITNSPSTEAVAAGARALIAPEGWSVHLLRGTEASALTDAEALGFGSVLARFGPYAVAGFDWSHPRSFTFAEDRGERLKYTPQVQAPPLNLSRANKVDPQVKQDIVDAVLESEIVRIIGDLSGENSFELNGENFLVNDRHTERPGHHTAANYLEDRLEAMGYTVVRQMFAVPAFPDPVVTQNIVAIKTGESTPNEIVVVGGHYDSTSSRNSLSGPAPGAEDNASGTAATLHLAGIFAPYQTDRTLHFVMFGGEEQGLYGSQEYVAQAVANNDEVVAALTMDMIAAFNTNYQIDIEGLSNWPALNELMDLVESNATLVSPLLGVDQKFNSFGSDHVPFQQAGIPAFLAIQSDYASYAPYHRTTDTADKLKPMIAYETVRALAASLADLTNPVSEGTAIAITGFSGEFRDQQAVLRWNLADLSGIAGVTVLRGYDGEPLSPAHAGVLAPRLSMTFTDLDVPPTEASTVTYALSMTSLSGDEVRLPGEVLLPVTRSNLWMRQSQPNPFSNGTFIQFYLPEPGPARLTIYDLAGRLVRTLVDGWQNAGPQSVEWSGRDEAGQPVSSGVYNYRLKHESRVVSKRLILRR